LKSDIPRGLYVVTDRVLCGRSGIVASVAAALAGGAAIVQYRDKTGDLARRECEAERLAQLSGESGALFIVNDDVDLALSCGADGVHLGREDTGIAEARSLLGPDRLIGVSCYDSIERAHEAAAAGCDYVAFGSAYPSPTKPDAVCAAISLYREAVSEIPLPVVAIGGITPENSPPLIAAGCHALAVISGVFGQDDPRAAAARYTRLFTGPAQAIR
jgi:thiamine-phosphate pyrophosphorylase